MSPVRRATGTILAVLLILAAGGITAGFEMTLLVVPSYDLVEEAHNVRVTYSAATGIYTLRYEAHDVIKIWTSSSTRPDEIERTIAARTVEYIDLSPYDTGTHTISARLLKSQPAVYQSFVVGDAGTLPAGSLPAVDPAGPGLAEAGVQDDIVAAAAEMLVTYEYLVLQDAEDVSGAEIDAAAAGVDEVTNVGNEETSGDPVLVASGMFTASEIDLALSAGAVSVVVERVHRSDLGLSGSLGSAWWLSLDTRIVLGESRRAGDVQAVALAGAASILTTDVASLATTYAASRLLITGPMSVARARLTTARRTYDALTRFKLTYDGPYQAVVFREIDRQLVIAGRLVAEGAAIVAQFSTHLANLDAAYGSTTTGALGALYDAAAEHQSVADLYGLHADRADSHAERNSRFVPGAPRSAGAPTNEGTVVQDARTAGNDSVTLIDTEGVPRRFSCVSAADLESERTYSDGSTNYHLSGTEFTPEKPTEDTLRLTADGEFVLTRKEGSIWIYGVCGQLLRIEDRNGNRATFHYNAEEQLHRITDSRGREVQLDRSPAGLLTDLYAPEETRIHYAYGAAGQLASVTDPTGDTVRYEYDRTRITRIIKPDESFREYSYEYIRGALRATTTTDEEGKAERFDFTLPDRTVYANPSGIQAVHHFNGDRRATRVDHEGGAEHPGGLYELFTYNSAGDRTYHRATDGTEHRYAYDERHNLLRVNYPDGTAKAWTYNSFDLPETFIDRRNHHTDYHYDERGNLTRVDHPDGSADIFTYEPAGMPAAGEVATHTDRRGYVRAYAYDARGFLRSISDTIGPVASYEHDALGRVVAYEDGLGNRTTYAFTLDGRLDTVTGPEGFFIDYDHDERKDSVRLVANGREATFQYDDRHLLILVTNALGETVTNDYRDDGLLRRRTVRNADRTEQSTTEFIYNDRGLLWREIQTDIGAVTEYEYDAAGRVAAVTGAEGSRTEYRYSFDGRPVARTRHHDGQLIEETVEYYPGGPMRQAVDPLDRMTRWEHNPVVRTLTQVDPLWNRSTSTFDPHGRILSETDPTGRSRFYDYDERGRLIALRNDLNTVAAYGYDAADRLVSFTDGENNTWRYGYDGRGRLVAVTHPDGAIRHIQHNLDDTIASETDETGLVTFYEYDPLGRMIARIDPDGTPGTFAATPESGRRTEYAWSFLGVPESVTDPTGRVTTNRMDLTGRVTGSWDNAGALTTCERDLEGVVTAVVDPTGRRTDYLYDNLHRLTEVRRAGEQTVRYEYDDAGNLRREHDGADEPHEYIYDDLNRLETEINRLSNEKHFTYDTAGRLSTITDYTGITAGFDYDAAGLLSEISYSDGTFLEYQYDRAGRMITTENQHERLEFGYTARGRLDFATGSTTGASLRYDYDAAGRRTVLEDLATGRRTDYLHDDRGFLVGLQDSVAGFTRLEYDAAGRRTQIVAPNGVTTSTTHDAVGRVAAIVVTNASLADPIIDGLAHAYDAVGRRLYDVDHRGAITGYEYDAQGRLSQVQYPFSGGKRLADYALFAEVGLVLPVPPGQSLGEEFDPGPADAEPGGTPYQSYLSLSPGAIDLIQEAYRLIHPLQKGGASINQQVWTEALDYDAAGNRAAWRTGWGEVRYTYDAASRLGRAAGAAYEHNLAGNLTRATTTAGATHYTYTAGNRLALAATPEATIAYTYDPLGRRSSRRSSAPFQGPSALDLTKIPSTTVHRTLYQYDGRSFAVTAREEVDYLGGGDLSSFAKSPAPDDSRYRPAPGNTLPPGVSTLSRSVYQEVTIPAARTLSISGPAETIYLSHDVLGSVRVSTGAHGVVETTYQYDAFGTALAPEFDLNRLDPTQPYGYNGKPQDPHTGLSNYGFRDYLPAIARFTTPDPVKHGYNWYAYVNNDPVNRVDPWGLAPRNLTDAQREAYQEHVATFADADAALPTYDSGPREDQDWDCADLSTYIASGAMDSATDDSEFYRNLTANGAALVTIPAIHSSDFAEDGNVTFYQTSDGSVDNAFESPSVEAGTIGVFSNHIITVTANRESTSDAIQTIQGHSSQDASWDPIGDQAVLDNYLGEFIGWAEIGSGSTSADGTGLNDIASGIKNR